MPRDASKRIANSRAIEGATRLTSELLKYIDENPTTELAKLIDDHSFRVLMAKRCSAPRYFPGPSEFKEALNRSISDLDPMIAGPEGGPSSDMQRYEG